MNAIKKSGSFQGSSNTLGGGGRFKQMVASGKSPALAAFIGKKLYGKKKMTTMATTGKKRASNKMTAPNSMPPTKLSPPKGIAVGNPNAIRT